MAGPFREGLARVAENSKWGYIDRVGKFAIPPQFDRAYEFSEGRAAVMVGKKFGYVDNSGNLVVPTKLSNGNAFSEGLASVNTGVRSSIEDISTVGFIDKSGGFAIRPQFLAAGRFQAGLCLVETEEHIGYIDHSGIFAWRSKFVEIGSFDPHHLLPPEHVHLDV